MIKPKEEDLGAVADRLDRVALAPMRGGDRRYEAWATAIIKEAAQKIRELAQKHKRGKQQKMDL